MNATLRMWIQRMRGLFCKDQMDRELDEELKSHLEMHVADNVRRGMEGEQARRDALIRLGGVEQTKEAVRDGYGFLWLKELMQESRYALRSLRKSPGFTFVAVLTLALGIGASTAIFSVIENVLMDPFPYKDSGRLVFLNIHDTDAAESDGRNGFSSAEFLDFAEQNHVFDGVIAAAEKEVLYRQGDRTERLYGAHVTPGTFEFLGVPALYGRALQPADYEPGAPPVFVMRYKTWVTQFGGDPRIVNKQFTLTRFEFRNGRAFTTAEVGGARKLAVVNQTFARRYLGSQNPIGQQVRLIQLETFTDPVANAWFEIVGVVGDTKNAGLQSPIEPEVWVPYTVTASGTGGILLRSAQQPGSLVNEVRSEIWTMDPGLAVAYSQTLEDHINAYSYAGPRFGFLLMSIFGVVGLVLVAIGVYSVLAYNTARKTHEIGIRMALGAEGANVLGMVIRSGLGLVISGVSIGLGVSLILGRLITAELWNVSSSDPLTLAGSVALLLLTGLVACWIPARRATRVEPMVALRYG